MTDAGTINDALLQYQASQTSANLKRLIDSATPHMQGYISSALSRRRTTTSDTTLSSAGDDMIQEAWISVVRQINQYGGYGATAWLFSILRGVIVRHFRVKNQVKRPKAIHLDCDLMQSEPADGLTSVERRRAQVEDQELVQRMLSRTNAQARDLLKLYYFDGLSQREISERYHVSENTIECRLRRARTELKAQYSGFVTARIPK